MPELIPPPDLLAAGGAAPESDQDSLMKALTSRVMGPPPEVGGPAAMMAGWGAGWQGQANPVLAQQIQQRESYGQEQLKVAGLLQEAEKLKTARRDARLNILKAMPDDDATFEMKTRGLASLLEEEGMPTALSSKMGRLYKTMSPDERKRAAKTAAILVDEPAMSPADKLQQFQASFPNQDPDVLTSFLGMAKSPTFRRANDLPTAEEEAGEAVKRQSEVNALLNQRYGITDPKIGGSIRRAALQKYNKTFDELTESQRRDTINMFDTSAPDEAKLTEIGTTRAQFNRLSGDFITVRDAYGRLRGAAEATAQNPSAAQFGDIAMVFNYMKILDPNSVVRETEYATAKNAAGVPDIIRNLWNKVKDGAFLQPEQRASMLLQAQAQFAPQTQRQIELENEYRGIATRSRMDPANVVVDYVGPFRQQGPLRPEAPVGQRTGGLGELGGKIAEKVIGATDILTGGGGKSPLAVKGRSVKARDRKTGRTATVHLDPGEELPANFEAIK